MSELLIRCSEAHSLMTEPKLKVDKELGNLSKTSLNAIRDMYLQNEFGYKDPVVCDEMMKGLKCEQDSMALVQTVLGGEFRLKNTEKFKNDYIIGTPDIILSDCVEDVKTCFNLKTFFNSELTDAYYWQLMCYMALTGKTKARLIYCLVPTPDEIVTDLKKRMYYKFGCDETNSDYEYISNQIQHNHVHLPNVLPAEKRIKIFDINYNENEIKSLYLKIEKARIYYKSLNF